MHTVWHSIRLIILSLFVAFAAYPTLELKLCFAQSAEQKNQDTKEKNKKDKEIRVFIRISKSFIELLMQDQIQLDFPIKYQLKLAKVTGHAKGSAKLLLELIPGRGNVGVIAKLNGDLGAKVNAVVPFASGTAVYQSNFSCRKNFSFDGKDFKQKAANATANGSTRLQQVCSNRGGVFGRLVRRIATRVFEKRKIEIDEQFNKSLKSSISEQMDDVGTNVITELNQINRYAEMIDNYFPDARNGPIQILTTESHLLAGFGTPDDDFPRIAKSNEKPSPEIEVWIRTRPIESKFIKLLNDWEVAHDLLKSYVADEQAKKIADNLRVDSRKGWTIIRVGVEKQAEKKMP